MKKDAMANGWIDRCSHGVNNPSIFRKLIQGFRHSRASRGRGKARPIYKAARLQQVFESSSLHKKGLSVEAIYGTWRTAQNIIVPTSSVRTRTFLKGLRGGGALC